MVQLLVNIVLAESVLDIIGFLVVLPVFVQLMDLTSHVPLLLQNDKIVNMPHFSNN